LSKRCSILNQPENDYKAPRRTDMRYKCTVCDHIYDPAEGDPLNGVPPGTPFGELPADWSCPECGARKEDFEPMG
jgi:rubredoxin